MRLAPVLSLTLLVLGGCRTSRKAPPVDAGPAESTADVPASPAQVQEVLRAARPEIDGCYRKAAEGKPDLAGSVAFKVALSPDGRVREATLDGPTTLDPTLVRCARMVLVSSQLNPPQGGRSLSMRLPLDFRPSGRPDASTP